MSALRLFDVVFTEKYTIQEKLIYLESCDNLATFVGEDERNIDNVRKKIKELLSSSDQRAEGLALLHTVLSQCSSRVFYLEAIAWLQLCVKTIENNDLPEIKKLSSTVLCQLIRYVSSYSDLSKKVSTSYISSLVETLLKITIEDEWKVEALQLLVSCMTYFPGPCGNSKIEIEKLVLKYLYSWNEKSLEVVTQCVAFLPLIGGQGNLGLSHTNTWFDQFSSILSSLDQLLEFFNDQSNLDDMDPLVLASLEIPKLPSDPLMSIFYASKLYQFLGLCLQKMICTNVDVPVKVPISSILAHVCQSLALKNTMHERINLDKIASYSILPSQHIVSLRILESLILCCGDVLIPNSTLINNLLLQTLEWSTDQEDSESEPTYYYSNLRKVVYQVLQTFVKKLGSNSQVHESLSAFYSHIHLDIKTKTDEVKLLNKSMQNEGSSNPRSKKKRKISIDLEPISKQESHKFYNPDCDAETVEESLAALKVILYNCGPHIKEDIYRNIQKTIITLLLKVQQNSNQIPVPYNNPRCRRELYQVLLAAVLCPSFSCPPPYQPAIRLFSSGQRDFVGSVSEFCGEASIICSSIAHPLVAPLQFCPPLQIQGSYMSEASDTASNESEYHEERDSIMEDDDDEEEYGMDSVLEIIKRPPQARAKLVVQSPNMPAPQKPNSILPATAPAIMERLSSQPSSTRNEIVLVEEDIESKNINMRNRLIIPTRTVAEERKPSLASVQQQLLRKNDEVKKAQSLGIAPLVDIPRNSQPRPKSVQNAVNAKNQDREVLDVSEEVEEMEGVSEDDEEEYEEEEDEEDGHYDDQGAEDSDDYYEREEMNDKEETAEERDEFRKSVYGETSIVCYSLGENDVRMAEPLPKADISKKSQIPLIQKNTPNSNSTTVTINNPNQRTIKTSSGIIKLEDCNSNEGFQTPNVPFPKTEATIQATKKNGASSLKNELTPKPNITSNEQNHIAVLEVPSQTSSKELDFPIVDISNSPMKPPPAILQNESDSDPMVLSVTSSSLAEHHSVVEETETQPCNENITIAAHSPEHTEPVNEMREILNQKSPQVYEDEDYRQEYEEPYEVEECVQGASEDDDRQLEDLDESEAKKSCIKVEEKPFEAMVKDFVPCAKDD